MANLHNNDFAPILHLKPTNLTRSIRIHHENSEQFVQLCSIIARQKQCHNIIFTQEAIRRINFTDIRTQYDSAKERDEIVATSSMNVLKIDKSIPGIHYISISDLDIAQELLRSLTFYPGAVLLFGLGCGLSNQEDNLHKNEFSLLNMMIN